MPRFGRAPTCPGWCAVLATSICTRRWPRASLSGRRRGCSSRRRFQPVELEELQQSPDKHEQRGLRPDYRGRARAGVSVRGQVDVLKVRVGRALSSPLFPGKVVAQLMGHAKVDTTLNVYTQMIDGALRTAVDKVGSELFTIVHKSETGAELIH